MTAKLDGTAGLLQQYDYQAPTTGFSYTFAAGVNVLVMQPAGTLATGTITMPAAPVDGMTITFSSTKTITALTVNANTGQSIVGAPTVLPANQAGAYVYRLSNTTWYPYETVPTNVPVAPAGGSTITSGTVQTSPPATPQYFDFTSIPSWVKRITVMLNGVSTNGTSNWLVQLGDSGGIETTGYSARAITLTNNSSATSTAGLISTVIVAAANATSGSIIISLLDSTTNTWVSQGNLLDPTNYLHTASGVKALSATLDRVRITTVLGTDTFDAGSINILYE
jgi:hypothetical protein